MNTKLDQLEAKLQSLFEDQIMAILPGLTIEERVIQKLALALKQNIVEQKENGSIAPQTFTLIVAVDSAPTWNEQRVMDALKNAIIAARRVGMGCTWKRRGFLTIKLTICISMVTKTVCVMAARINGINARSMSINSTDTTCFLTA